jgi:hypothetical protein
LAARRRKAWKTKMPVMIATEVVARACDFALPRWQIADGDRGRAKQP